MHTLSLFADDVQQCLSMNPDDKNQLIKLKVVLKTKGPGGPTIS